MKLIKKIMAFAAVTALTASFTVSDLANVKEVNGAVQTLSNETLNYYEQWKNKYVTENPYVTEEKQYYVFYGEKTYAEAGYTVEVTVSEAHGYGMLIMAGMAEYDSQAKDIFDGMYRFYKAHPSSIGPNLMAWQQGDNGSAIINVSGEDSASDGDMDIAYALLMADTVWGSSGYINYKQAAIDIINDVMTYEVNKTDWIIQLGDWAHWEKEGDLYYSATRASDFFVQYMPVFAEATGDERWMNVYNSTYDIINKFIREHGTGLLPDFIVKNSSGEFVAASANLLESADDGNYYYNSCRVPWRIGMDYLINDNEDALAYANAITDFMSNTTNGDPWEVKSGYAPDGTFLGDDYDYNDLCFTAPLLISASCTDNKEWHDAVRDVILDYDDDVYYGETISMLCLISDDGGWIVPETKKSDILYGDANDNGEVETADAVYILQGLADPSNDEFNMSTDGLAKADCQNVGNGVDPEDALAILKFKAKLINGLPA